MKLLIQRTTFFAVTAGLFGACGGGTTIHQYEAQETPEEPTDSHSQPLTDNDTPEPQKTTPPAPKIEVVAAARTPLEGKKAPTLRFVQPRKNSVAKSDIRVKFDLKNWKLGADPGKHVHLFIDDKPYIAIRDVSKPINLNELYKETFGEDLAEGTHILRAFPSRATHESVKEGTPFAYVVVHYKSKTEGFTFEPTTPVLVYSRPKGCVVAGQPALLDFYLANVERLGSDEEGKEGYTVTVLVNDKRVAKISEWAPHQISGLPVGEHKIRLLLASNGEPVATTLKSEQTINVKAVCEAPKPAEEKAEAGASASANVKADTKGAAAAADKGKATAAEASKKAQGAANSAAKGAGNANVKAGAGVKAN